MLEKTTDGFEISEYDFQNRGEGDLFGVRQSGEIGLVLANVSKDYKMLLKVKEDVEEFTNNYIDKLDEFPEIKQRLEMVDNLN